MRISKSPLTGKEYTLPEGGDDGANIEAFLARNSGKPVVVVQGLGFVGAVMSLICANAPETDYAVIGVDLPTQNTFWKIQSLNEGVFPLVADDPNIELLYRAAVEAGSFYATFDERAYAAADVVIVDINLDVAKTSTGWNELTGYDVDLTGFTRAMQSIGRHCKPDALLLVETTVPPGTCDKVVRPVIEAALTERGLPTDQIRIGHSYERVMPGKNYVDSIRNYFRVFSGVDEASAQATEAFLRTIISTDEYPLTRLGNTNATEMAKVLENSYRAMNIAFIVEWTRFAEEAGVNLYEVVRAIRKRNTHANIMLPGIGVGGYCLTKDPLLASWARQQLFGSDSPLTQSEAGVAINDRMPFYAFEFLKAQYDGDLRGSRVLLLGVSYRQEVGDTRYTPVEVLYDCLLDAGAIVTLHDPHVPYWEEKDLHLTEELDDVIARDHDVVVISTGHPQYRAPEFVATLMETNPVLLYDTVGLYPEADVQRLSTRHTVKVLGRGDL